VITNWFVVAVAVLQIGATVQYALAGSWRMAAMNLLIAVANGIYATMEGQ
jgi:hypothetical protein